MQKLVCGHSFYLWEHCFFSCRIIFGFNELTSVLVAIGLSTTSLALVYSVLKEKHAIRSRSAQGLLSAAMIVDVISMVSLMILFQGISFATVVVIVMIPLTKLVVPHVGQLGLQSISWESN